MSIIKYYHTLRYLKVHQLFSLVKTKIFKRVVRSDFKISTEKITFIHLSFVVPFPFKKTSLVGDTFTFLNKTKVFNNDIDWSFSLYGNLWCYNLNYMDFLLQQETSLEKGLELIQDFMNSKKIKPSSFEPYPISLRGINWIKFISAHRIDDPKIISHLYKQYIYLSKNLEHHLKANHLLENGISLLFGALFFHDERFWVKAKRIIPKELKEQILDDGGHFELSTMYHQVILEHLLDAINLLKSNTCFKDQNQLTVVLESRVEKMMSWLNNMTFSNGEIPLLNDSANEVALSTAQLNIYYEDLGLTKKSHQGQLKESGYRRFNSEKYECIVDIGKIGPDYQPGHAHSDVFNFIVFHGKKQIITDAGTSTYENNQLRHFQRSVRAHNTVELDSIDPNEMYDSFKVGKRIEKVDVLNDTLNEISVQHKGYGFLGVTHHRTFQFGLGKIVIKDSLLGRKKNDAVSRIHLNPDLQVKLDKNTVHVEDITIHFKSAENITISEYIFAQQFNLELKASVIEVSFKQDLVTTISFK